MSRQQGQIIKKDNNKWLVRAYMGLDGNGKRKYHNKTINGTKKDAQKYLNGVLREQDLGIFIEPTKESVGNFFDYWLENSAKLKLKHSTYLSYVETFNRYLRADLGTILLTQLTPAHIQLIYTKLLENGLSANTIKRIHGILRAALNHALRHQKISRNPCLLVDLPRVKKEEMIALTADEVKRFLEEAKTDKWYTLFLVLLYTGMRPGEAFGLKWSDINDDRIHLQWSISKNKNLENGWEFEELKTKSSVRSITIPKSVQTALKHHRKNQLEEQILMGQEYENFNLVFASQNGTPLNARNIINRHFKKILKRAGLPEKMRLYDLRHTHATLLLLAGENPKVVSERLGHSTIRMTMDVYSHVLPNMQEKVAERLEKMLF